MARSKITIEFVEITEINDVFSFRDNLTTSVFNETFKTIRSAMYQTTIPLGVDIAPDGEPPQYVYSNFLSSNFATAFNLDYNTTGLFTISVTNGTVGSGLGTVVIEANYDNAEFELLSSLDSTNVTIENQTAIDVLTIDSVDIDAASIDQCSEVEYTIETNILAENITSPISVSGNTNNPFTFVFPRNQNGTISVNDGLGQVVNYNFTSPPFFDISARQIQINTSPFGANLTINLNNDIALSIEYSLDNTTWQPSNVFNGLDVENYTVYVRDQYGCAQQFDIVITESNVNSPYFHIPKTNSIRYANRITFGDAANYRNDENTLSCEAFAKDVRLRHKEYQLFQTADKIKTQFRSNYAENLAHVIKSDGTEIPVSVIQKTTNIGNKIKIDGKIYAYSPTMSAVYFVGGNIYNYDTDAITSTHNLNGTLPDFAVVGNYILYSGSFYLIEDIVFDENKNADVILFSNAYAGAVDASVIVGSIYNLNNYEVYEFEIDMVDYLDQNIQVRINANDPNFQDLIWLSETINVKVRQEGTVDIHYWNDNNTDVNYSTGIKHRIRVVLLSQKAEDPIESDNHKTDTKSTLLSSSMYEGEEFIFEPTTKEMHRKLKAALLHDNVFIDEVQYVIDGAPEVEQLGDTNLYEVKVKMIKAGEQFANDTTSGVEFNSSSESIPGLIETESGFVKY